MRIVPRHLIDSERDTDHPLVEPRDAATLILLDRTDGPPRVLMGRRHAGNAFMPNKFVFPGGLMDAVDGTMPASTPLDPAVELLLLRETQNRGSDFPRALALAAIRETFEETGIAIGAPPPVSGEIPRGSWAEFARAGLYPDLAALHLVARAITPPGFPHRFDARFFCVDVKKPTQLDGYEPSGITELSDMRWVAITEALRLDIPVITGLVLRELEERIASDGDAITPVAFFRMVDGEFKRDLLRL